MFILKSLINRLVDIALVDLVHRQPGARFGEFVEFAREVLALLVSALGGGGEGGEFGVDLAEEFRELGEV